jgi:hypothetical protein
MTTLKRGLRLLSLLIAFSLLLGSAALAQNQAFPSTSLESSGTWYSLQFSAGISGVMDRIRMTFPAGMVSGNVGLGALAIGGTASKAAISVDGTGRIVVNLTTAKTVAPATKIALEVVGLTNPTAGNYEVDIELLNSTGGLLGALPPIPFSIDALTAGTGDITGVIAGSGLTGGGVSGDVTLTVNQTQIQKRVTGTCAAGTAVRIVKQDGTVTCEPVGGGAGGGTVTSVGTSGGLTGGPITTAGTLSVATGGITTALLANGAVTGVKLGVGSVDSSKIVAGSVGSAAVNSAQVQLRVAGNCTAGNAIRAIDAAGLVTCEATGGGGGAGGWTDGGTAVRLTTGTDRVGIGTATPISKVEIAGAQDALTITGPQPFLTLRDSNGGNKSGFVQGANGAIILLTETRHPLVMLDTNGNVGIGTHAPTSKLEIAAQDGLAVTGFQPFLTLRDSNGGNRSAFMQGVNGDVVLLTNSRQSMSVRDSDGQVSVRTLQIRGGADLSENFDVRGAEMLRAGAAAGEVPPGTLVAIDPAHPGKLVVSHRAYDRRVAGIVSGAGGVSPGMVLGQAGTLADGKHPVALTGRVYCWVDASHGPVEPGDLLTTSDTPGHAMKVTDPGKAQGAIVGKAMTSLQSGTGLVLVLVTLQ